MDDNPLSTAFETGPATSYTALHAGGIMQNLTHEMSAQAGQRVRLVGLKANFVWSSFRTGPQGAYSIRLNQGGRQEWAYELKRVAWMTETGPNSIKTRNKALGSRKYFGIDKIRVHVDLALLTLEL